jgi:hypothetical protein
MHRSLSFLTGAVLFMGVPWVSAAEEQHGAPAFYFQGMPDYYKLIEGTRSFARADFGEGAAPWLPHVLDVLRWNRPPAFRIDSVGVFKGAGDSRYLVIDWNQGRAAQFGRIEFHKVESESGRVRLKFLRETKPDYNPYLARPSGQLVFPGQPTIAVIGYGSGSGYTNYALRLIQLKRNTLDITPDWAGRIVDVADLDKDGAFEVIAMDDRWARFFVSCGACGPSVPIVLTRISGKFRPACKKFARFYHADIKETLLYVEKIRTENKFYISLYSSLAPNVLSLIQIGEFRKARKKLNHLIRAAAEEGFPKHGKRAQRVFGQIIELAKKNHSYQCVLSATKFPSDHKRTTERVEAFRKNSTVRSK